MSSQTPPARGKAPPPAQQAKGTGEKAHAPPPARRPPPVQPHTLADAAQEMGMDTAEAVVTAGHNGERNLRIQWITVPLSPNWTSCRFAVSSLPEHRLSAEMEQVAYRKGYAAEGSFQTDVVPVAAHGIQGRLVVRDLDTGEVLEQPWTWRTWGGGNPFSWIFRLIRKLFAKPKG